MTEKFTNSDGAHKTARKRTPRGYDTILAGARSLPLKDRIELAKELTRINTDEVQGKQREAEEAAALLKA